MPADVERELEKCLSWLFGYAVSLTGEREAARDLVQDCAAKALAAAAAPADRAALRAWLFRILRNAWIDGKRRDGRSPFETGEFESVADTEYWHGDERLIHGIAVKQALERLSVAHREVIALVDLAGFTYAEVAGILEVPVGTIMSRLARGRRSLLDALGDGNVRALRDRRSRT